MGKSQDLYKKAKKMIPGGTQLLSKRPEMFLPEFWPAYYKKSKGCEVWDLDGKKYIDMCVMGVGACILGYADPDVNRAVKKVVDNGNMSTLNAPEEVELAEILIKLHPWAQMVRYAKTGGEAMAIAVRIARARARKDVVLFCGYHGWHDWYLSANLSDDRSLDGHLLPGLNPLGVPRALQNHSLPFQYNDTAGFLKLSNKYKDQIGVIVIEAIRNVPPKKEFIRAIQNFCRRNKVVFVVDDITSAWRLHVGGAHLLYAINPDIAVFGKAISNGYPMAAIIGTKDVMEIAQDTFISSTYWTDRIGPAAAVATIKKMLKINAPKYLIENGKKIKSGWRKCAEKHGLQVEISGIDPLPHLEFICKNPLILKTLFTQYMLEQGFLASTGYYASCAHKETHIRAYLKAVDAAFNFISLALDSGTPEKYLKGPVCHSGFKRLT